MENIHCHSGSLIVKIFQCGTLAKTTNSSFNIFSLLYIQIQDNEIEISLKYIIILMILGVHWVVTIQFSSIRNILPTFVNVILITWQKVNTSSANNTWYLLAYSNVTQSDLFWGWLWNLVQMLNQQYSECLWTPWGLNLTNDWFHTEVVHDI